MYQKNDNCNRYCFYSKEIMRFLSNLENEHCYSTAELEAIGKFNSLFKKIVVLPSNNAFSTLNSTHSKVQKPLLEEEFYSPFFDVMGHSSKGSQMIERSGSCSQTKYKCEVETTKTKNSVIMGENPEVLLEHEILNLQQPFHSSSDHYKENTDSELGIPKLIRPLYYSHKIHRKFTNTSKREGMSSTKKKNIEKSSKLKVCINDKGIPDEKTFKNNCAKQKEIHRKYSADLFLREISDICEATNRYLSSNFKDKNSRSLKCNSASHLPNKKDEKTNSRCSTSLMTFETLEDPEEMKSIIDEVLSNLKDKVNDRISCGCDAVQSSHDAFSDPKSNDNKIMERSTNSNIALPKYKYKETNMAAFKNRAHREQKIRDLLERIKNITECMCIEKYQESSIKSDYKVREPSNLGMEKIPQLPTDAKLEENTKEPSYSGRTLDEQKNTNLEFGIPKSKTYVTIDDVKKKERAKKLQDLLKAVTMKKKCPCLENVDHKRSLSAQSSRKSLIESTGISSDKLDGKDSDSNVSRKYSRKVSFSDQISQTDPTAKQKAVASEETDVPELDDGKSNASMTTTGSSPLRSKERVSMVSEETYTPSIYKIHSSTNTGDNKNKMYEEFSSEDEFYDTSEKKSANDKSLEKDEGDNVKKETTINTDGIKSFLESKDSSEAVKKAQNEIKTKSSASESKEGKSDLSDHKLKQEEKGSEDSQDIAPDSKDFKSDAIQRKEHELLNDKWKSEPKMKEDVRDLADLKLTQGEKDSKVSQGNVSKPDTEDSESDETQIKEQKQFDDKSKSKPDNKEGEIDTSDNKLKQEVKASKDSRDIVTKPGSKYSELDGTQRMKRKQYDDKIISITPKTKEGVGDSADHKLIKEQKGSKDSQDNTSKPDSRGSETDRTQKKEQNRFDDKSKYSTYKTTEGQYETGKHEQKVKDSKKAQDSAIETDSKDSKCDDSQKISDSEKEPLTKEINDAYQDNVNITDLSESNEHGSKIEKSPGGDKNKMKRKEKPHSILRRETSKKEAIDKGDFIRREEDRTEVDEIQEKIRAEKLRSEDEKRKEKVKEEKKESSEEHSIQDTSDETKGDRGENKLKKIRDAEIKHEKSPEKIEINTSKDMATQDNFEETRDGREQKVRESEKKRNKDEKTPMEKKLESKSKRQTSKSLIKSDDKSKKRREGSKSVDHKKQIMSILEGADGDDTRRLTEDRRDSRGSYKDYEREHVKRRKSSSSRSKVQSDKLIKLRSGTDGKFRDRKFQEKSITAESAKSKYTDTTSDQLSKNRRKTSIVRDIHTIDKRDISEKTSTFPLTNEDIEKKMENVNREISCETLDSKFGLGYLLEGKKTECSDENLPDVNDSETQNQRTLQSKILTQDKNVKRSDEFKQDGIKQFSRKETENSEFSPRFDTQKQFQKEGKPESANKNEMKSEKLTSIPDQSSNEDSKQILLHEDKSYKPTKSEKDFSSSKSRQSVTFIGGKADDKENRTSPSAGKSGQYKPPDTEDVEVISDDQSNSYISDLKKKMSIDSRRQFSRSSLEYHKKIIRKKEERSDVLMKTAENRDEPDDNLSKLLVNSQKHSLRSTLDDGTNNLKGTGGKLDKVDNKTTILKNERKSSSRLSSEGRRNKLQGIEEKHISTDNEHKIEEGKKEKPDHVDEKTKTLEDEQKISPRLSTESRKSKLQGIKEKNIPTDNDEKKHKIMKGKPDHIDNKTKILEDEWKSSPQINAGGQKSESQEIEEKYISTDNDKKKYKFGEGKKEKPDHVDNKMKILEDVRKISPRLSVEGQKSELQIIEEKHISTDNDEKKHVDNESKILEDERKRSPGLSSEGQKNKSRGIEEKHISTDNDQRKHKTKEGKEEKLDHIDNKTKILEDERKRSPDLSSKDQKNKLQGIEEKHISTDNVENKNRIDDYKEVTNKSLPIAEEQTKFTDEKNIKHNEVSNKGVEINLEETLPESSKTKGKENERFMKYSRLSANERKYVRGQKIISEYKKTNGRNHNYDKTKFTKDSELKISNKISQDIVEKRLAEGKMKDDSAFYAVGKGKSKKYKYHIIMEKNESNIRKYEEERDVSRESNEWKRKHREREDKKKKIEPFTKYPNQSKKEQYRTKMNNEDKIMKTSKSRHRPEDKTTISNNKEYQNNYHPAVSTIPKSSNKIDRRLFEKKYEPLNDKDLAIIISDAEEIVDSVLEKGEKEYQLRIQKSREPITEKNLDYNVEKSIKTDTELRKNLLSGETKKFMPIDPKDTKKYKIKTDSIIDTNKISTKRISRDDPTYSKPPYPKEDMNDHIVEESKTKERSKKGGRQAIKTEPEPSKKILLDENEKSIPTDSKDPNTKNDIIRTDKIIEQNKMKKIVRDDPTYLKPPYPERDVKGQKVEESKTKERNKKGDRSVAELSVPTTSKDAKNKINNIKQQSGSEKPKYEERSKFNENKIFLREIQLTSVKLVDDILNESLQTVHEKNYSYEKQKERIKSNTNLYKMSIIKEMDKTITNEKGKLNNSMRRYENIHEKEVYPSRNDNTIDKATNIAKFANYRDILEDISLDKAMEMEDILKRPSPITKRKLIDTTYRNPPSESFKYKMIELEETWSSSSLKTQTNATDISEQFYESQLEPQGTLSIFKRRNHFGKEREIYVPSTKKDHENLKKNSSYAFIINNFPYKGIELKKGENIEYNPSPLQISRSKYDDSSKASRLESSLKSDIREKESTFGILTGDDFDLESSIRLPSSSNKLSRERMKIRKTSTQPLSNVHGSKLQLTESNVSSRFFSAYDIPFDRFLCGCPTLENTTDKSPKIFEDDTLFDRSLCGCPTLENTTDKSPKTYEDECSKLCCSRAVENFIRDWSEESNLLSRNLCNEYIERCRGKLMQSFSGKKINLSELLDSSSDSEESCQKIRVSSIKETVPLKRKCLSEKCVRFKPHTDILENKTKSMNICKSLYSNSKKNDEICKCNINTVFMFSRSDSLPKSFKSKPITQFQFSHLENINEDDHYSNEMLNNSTLSSEICNSSYKSDEISLKRNVEHIKIRAEKTRPFPLMILKNDEGFFCNLNTRIIDANDDKKKNIFYRRTEFLAEEFNDIESLLSVSKISSGTVIQSCSKIVSRLSLNPSNVFLLNGIFTMNISKKLIFDGTCFNALSNILTKSEKKFHVSRENIVSNMILKGYTLNDEGNYKTQYNAIRNFESENENKNYVQNSKCSFNERINYEPISERNNSRSNKKKSERRRKLFDYYEKKHALKWKRIWKCKNESRPFLRKPLYKYSTAEQRFFGETESIISLNASPSFYSNEFIFSSPTTFSDEEFFSVEEVAQVMNVKWIEPKSQKKLQFHNDISRTLETPSPNDSNNNHPITTEHFTTNNKKERNPYRNDIFLYYATVTTDDESKVRTSTEEAQKKSSYKKATEKFFSWFKTLGMNEKTVETPRRTGHETLCKAEVNLMKQRKVLRSKLRYTKTKTSKLYLHLKDYNLMKGEISKHHIPSTIEPVLMEIPSSEIIEPEFEEEFDEDSSSEDEELEEKPVTEREKSKKLIVFSEDSLVLFDRKKVYDRLQEYAKLYYTIYLDNQDDLDHVSIRSASFDHKIECGDRPFYATYDGMNDIRVHVTKDDFEEKKKEAVFRNETHVECQNSQVKLSLMRGKRYLSHLDPTKAKIIEIDCSNELGEIKICYKKSEHSKPCLCDPSHICKAIQLESSELSSIDMNKEDKSQDTQEICEDCRECLHKPETCENYEKCLDEDVCANKKRVIIFNESCEDVRTVEFFHVPRGLRYRRDRYSYAVTDENSEEFDTSSDNSLEEYLPVSSSKHPRKRYNKRKKSFIIRNDRIGKNK